MAPQLAHPSQASAHSTSQLQPAGLMQPSTAALASQPLSHLNPAGLLPPQHLNGLQTMTNANLQAGMPGYPQLPWLTGQQASLPVFCQGMSCNTARFEVLNSCKSNRKMHAEEQSNMAIPQANLKPHLCSSHQPCCLLGCSPPMAHVPTLRSPCTLTMPRPSGVCSIDLSYLPGKVYCLALNVELCNSTMKVLVLGCPLEDCRVTP